MAPLHFNGHQFPCSLNQKIDFLARLSSPKIKSESVIQYWHELQQLTSNPCFDHGSGMTLILQGLPLIYSHEMSRHSCIIKIKLGGLHQSLPQMSEIRPYERNLIGYLEQIHIPAECCKG